MVLKMRWTLGLKRTLNPVTDVLVRKRQSMALPMVTQEIRSCDDERDTGRLRAQETKIMGAGRQRKKLVSEPLGNMRPQGFLGELCGDKKQQACDCIIWESRTAFLHPVGMLGDNAPFTVSSHMAAPTFYLPFLHSSFLANLLHVPNTRPASHTHLSTERTWSPKGLSSKYSGEWPRIYPSCQHKHWSPTVSLLLGTLHMPRSHVIAHERSTPWLPWKLQREAIPGSYRSSFILSIWVCRSEHMCLSFTFKILYGEVNGSPMPILVWFGQRWTRSQPTCLPYY